MKKIFKNKKDSLNVRSQGEKALYTFVFIVLVLWTLLLLYPVFWIVLNSFKDVDSYYDSIFGARPFDFPTTFHFDNYVTAITNISIDSAIDTSFLGMLFNTLWYCAIRVGMAMFVPLATAYAMCKYEFPGRKLIYNVVILFMIIPVFGTGGAAFTYYHDLRIYNTPLFVIYTGLAGFEGNFLLSYGYVKSISWGYAESVYIDGGNDYTVFFKIMLPICAPWLIVSGVLAFIHNWNDYGTMLIYLPDYPTLASGVYLLSEGNDSLRYTNPPAYFAALIITTIPVVVVFGIFSDKIMKNLTIGGLKG